MGFLDRMLGRTSVTPQTTTPAPRSADEQAIARYRYLLRTAPPEAVEQAHAEAFARLTPEQRQQVLNELASELPPAERGQANSTDPQALARMATRAEIRQPGFLERSLGQRQGMGGGGIGMGGMIAGSLLSSVAGAFIGTAIANQFLGGFDEHQASEDAAGGEPSEQNDEVAARDEAASGSEDPQAGDFGGDDFDGGDFDV